MAVRDRSSGIRDGNSGSVAGDKSAGWSPEDGTLFGCAVFEAFSGQQGSVAKKIEEGKRERQRTGAGRQEKPKIMKITD